MVEETETKSRGLCVVIMMEEVEDGSEEQVYDMEERKGMVDTVVRRAMGGSTHNWKQ